MKGQFCLMKIKLISVEPILFLYMLVIFMETMALQELFYVKSCLQLNQPVNISVCSYALKHNRTREIDETALWFKRYSCCLFFFTFISSLYIGSWSDRFGRKLPMLIPPIGTACASIVNCLLSVFINAHVAYFFISSVISGITFGSVGIIATTFGYISDFTHKQSRSKRIVILESMLFIGGTTGIYTSGLFLKDPHYDYVVNEFAMLFIFEAVVSIFIIIYISLVIPSHIPESQSLESPLSRAGYFNIKHVIESLKTVFRPREGEKRKKVLLMLLSLFLIYFGGVVQTALGYYFVKELGWKLPEYTLFHALQFILEGAALLIGLPTLLYFFNVPDYVFAIIGMLSRIAGFVVFGLSTNNIMIYSCVALYIFSEFPIPALRSMLSKTVDEDEKGRIFAFTACLQNLCYFLGSFILLTVFKEFTFKGLCFEIVAVLQGIALLIIIYLFLTRYEYVTSYTIIENEDGTVSEIKSVVASTDSVN